MSCRLFLRSFYNFKRIIHFSTANCRLFISKEYAFRNRPLVNNFSCGCRNLSRIDEILDDDVETEIEYAKITGLHYDKSDPFIKNIRHTTTVSELFQLLERNKNEINKTHVIQSILMLWYFENVFLKTQHYQGTITDYTEEEYERELHALPEFQSFLQQVDDTCHLYDVDELTCSLLYLSKMGVALRSTTCQKLIANAQKKFQDDSNTATLTALSRFCVALKTSSELWSRLEMVQILTLFEQKIVNVSTADDMKLLTICVLHTHFLQSKPFLVKYQDLCRKLATDGSLTSDDGKHIVKAISALSFPFWCNENTEIVRKLAELLKGHLKKLEIKDMIALSKSFHVHLEPSYLAEELSVTANNYLSSVNQLTDKEMNAGVLSCAAQLSNYKDRPRFVKMLHRELNSGYFAPNMNSFFTCLRSLKTADRQLCNLFWSKTVDLLSRHSSERECHKLLRIGMRYMYFNNNMGGTFRYYPFENELIRWISHEIETGITACNPMLLSRAVSFLLGYCQEPAIISSAVDLLLASKSRLSKLDCSLLSRGLEIMIEFTRKKRIHPDVMQKIVDLETALNECSWRHLAEENDTFSGAPINALLRAFCNRRASKDSLLFHSIMNRIENRKYPMCSRYIRETSICLMGLNCLIPSLIEKMTTYIIDNEEFVLAETAEKTLSLAFQLNYNPTNGEKFFETSCRLLVRDKDRLTSLQIIQCCLALSFFHQFPKELVDHVFAVDFLERIDEELAECYGKASYPVKVRYSLMELNRSVCLDLPELDVPWFHTKYCEEISALDPGINTVFHENVKEHLLQLLGGEQYLKTSVYSPYAHKINFLVLLDDRTKPLHKSQEKGWKERVAFLLHSENQYTVGVRKLKGQQQLRQRHLEMMGYRVVPIAERVWNAMYLAEPHAKRTFLADLLWPER